ncbi:fungal-specific transcription factor domain-containing protein [Aspergillus varians]
MALSQKRLHAPRHRNHALGVCVSCRTRHVKCDLRYPSCSACQAIGVVCESYDSELRWMSARTGDMRTRHRGSSMQGPKKHLYTEKDRVSMSTALQSSLASAPISHSLEEIERLSARVPFVPGKSSFVGPFGVLELKTRPQGGGTATSSRACPPTPGSHTAEIPADSNDYLSTMLHDYMEPFDPAIADACLDWPDLFDMNSQWPRSTITPPPDPELGSATVDRQPAHEDGRSGLPLSIPTLEAPSKLEGIDMSDAEILLAHFRSKVIPDMFSSPSYEKSPLEILNTNSAVLTLASVNYMGTRSITHAAMANLLALLAISARHFAAGRANGPLKKPLHWEEISKSAYQQAKAHLKLSLTVELQDSRPPKYKDQLMAISAVLGFAILHDHQLEARAYLVDSERLVRLRGLSKKVVSRKASLLHHVYTWNRILSESTAVIHTNGVAEDLSNAGCMITPSYSVPGDLDREISPNTQSRPRVDLDDFLRLEGHSSGSHPAPQRGHGTILNDHHLEDSREDAKAMYRQLYGVSETWLSLVSQTTRLANVMDRMNSAQGPRDDGLRTSIQKKKQWLEDMIWQLAGSDPAAVDGEPPKTPHGTTEQPRAYMVRALNQGLLIFFYRRIHALDSRLLQPYVASAVQALKGFKDACVTCNVEVLGSVWPVFMAGCEAISPADREFVTNWMDEAFSKTGFPRFKTIKQCMEMVWQGRGQSRWNNNGSGSWIAICRERNMHIMLS